MTNKRNAILENIDLEREYQNTRWGKDFDDKNTPNDWVAYIANYLGKAVTMPFDDNEFRHNLYKIAALAVAALEQDSYAPRHYDASKV